MAATVARALRRAMGVSLAQAEQRKDGHDHHDEADQIDNAVHVSLPRFVKKMPSARRRQLDREVGTAAASAALAKAAAE